jgi:hypothetical protein
MYLRAEQLALSGRDHMMFRSFYGPCKVPVPIETLERDRRRLVRVVLRVAVLEVEAVG